MTQSELADAAGVSARTNHNLELDKTWPQKPNRNRVERALGWAPGSLEQIRNGGDPTPLDIPLGEGTAGAGYRQYLEAHESPTRLPGWLGDMEDEMRAKSAVDSKGRPLADTMRQAVLGNEDPPAEPEGEELDTYFEELRESMRVLDDLPAPVQKIVMARALDSFEMLSDLLSLEGLHRLTRYGFLVLDEEDETRAHEDQDAEDAARRGEGPSASSVGGESRREFHTDRMSEEELRELAATDDTWGGYVETRKDSVEQEGRR
jgi:hypothetical protein